jgi:hypothetical protein
MMQKRLPFICLFFVILVTAGCSHESKIATDVVKGKVTLDGEPIGGVSINFTPEGNAGGRSAYGVSREDGTYTLSTLGGAAGQGTTTGKYIVTVSKIIEESTGKQEPDPNDPTQMREQKIAKDMLPLKYKNAKSSPLKVTVHSGKNTIDLALEKNK